MGTVGADVSPASGRDRVGGQQRLGQGRDRSAGRAMCPGAVGGWSYYYHRQGFCPLNFSSLGSTEAGGSHGEGASPPRLLIASSEGSQTRDFQRKRFSLGTRDQA